LLPLKKQAAYSDYLVNFQRAQPSKSGQFSVRGNTGECFKDRRSRRQITKYSLLRRTARCE